MSGKRWMKKQKSRRGFIQLTVPIFFLQWFGTLGIQKKMRTSAFWLPRFWRLNPIRSWNPFTTECRLSCPVMPLTFGLMRKFKTQKSFQNISSRFLKSWWRLIPYLSLSILQETTDPNASKNRPNISPLFHPWVTTVKPAWWNVCWLTCSLILICRLLRRCNSCLSASPAGAKYGQLRSVEFARMYYLFLPLFFALAIAVDWFCKPAGSPDFLNTLKRAFIATLLVAAFQEISQAVLAITSGIADKISDIKWRSPDTESVWAIIK